MNNKKQSLGPFRGPDHRLETDLTGA